MSSVQGSIINGLTPEVILAVPGIQGAAGVSAYSTISGTSYTLAEGDRSKILVFTASGATTVTVPSGLSTLFDAMIVQAGAGQITISGASGVTINSSLGARRTAYQYAVTNLIPIAPNTFILSGEVAV